jgi:hypothetical protein
MNDTTKNSDLISVSETNFISQERSIEVEILKILRTICKSVQQKLKEHQDITRFLVSYYSPFKKARVFLAVSTCMSSISRQICMMSKLIRDYECIGHPLPECGSDFEQNLVNRYKKTIDKQNLVTILKAVNGLISIFIEPLAHYNGDGAYVDIHIERFNSIIIELAQIFFCVWTRGADTLLVNPMKTKVELFRKL